MPINPWLLQQLHAADEDERAIDRTLKTIGVAAAGVAIGAALMALITPRTGRQLRASVVTRAQQFVNPFGGLHEEATRPEPLARIAAIERAELIAKVRALNEDDIDIDSALPMHRERSIV